eukprot:6982775-Prymnesium_polylepis.1
MARASARRVLSRAFALPVPFRESEAATVARMAVTVGSSVVTAGMLVASGPTNVAERHASGGEVGAAN